MTKFSFLERLRNLSTMQSREFDLLIIGGGITGAGAARDAAARGLKVALIEARDFASGTSSRSSKLIHGGIRYLENMEFKLVFEALNERTKLFEMCPHLVHHLRFMIPLYDDSRVGMGKMGLGMWLYDALALFQAPEWHERLDGHETMDRMPSLRARGLKGSFIYSDGYMDDDRLVHETMRSAAAHGAIAANDVEARGAIFGDDGHIREVRVRDTLTAREFSIKARHVISTVGPWTDDLGSHLFKDWKSVLRPTKGVHLTVSKDRLPLNSAVVMAAEKSDRIVFAIPRAEMVIIGTTDTDFSGSPRDVGTTNEDVDYLLGVTSHYFPGARLTRADLIASYAGVRPLVRDDSSSEGKTSREHTIFTDPRGVTFVAGGKYTTYRLMARQVVDEAMKSFPLEDRLKHPAYDTTRPLNDDTSPDAYHQSFLEVPALAEAYARHPDDILHLCTRYGREVESILRRAPSGANLWQIEAQQAIETTMCQSLVDFYVRRVPLFLATPDHGLRTLEDVARTFQRALGWSDEKTAAEKAAYHHYINAELAWK